MPLIASVFAIVALAAICIALERRTASPSTSPGQRVRLPEPREQHLVSPITLASPRVPDMFTARQA